MRNEWHRYDDSDTAHEYIQTENVWISRAATVISNTCLLSHLNSISLDDHIRVLIMLHSVRILLDAAQSPTSAIIVGIYVLSHLGSVQWQKAVSVPRNLRFGPVLRRRLQ